MSKTQEPVIFDNGAVYLLQTGLPVFVKTADICALTEKTNQWIGQLTAQGVLHKTKTPQGSFYELSENIGDYCRYLEERGGQGADLEIEKKKADVRLKNSKAAVAELELKEVRGEMHRSEDVAAVMQDFAFAVRGALLGLPGKLSIELSHIDEPAKISGMIQSEIYKILEDLSEYEYDSQKFKERVRNRKKMNLDSSDDEGTDYAESEQL